jgi:hypothetical protein
MEIWVFYKKNEKRSYQFEKRIRRKQGNKERKVNHILFRFLRKKMNEVNPNSEIPALQTLCMHIIINNPKFKTIDFILHLFSSPLDFDLPTFAPLKNLITRNLKDYHPFLVDKYGIDALKENFPSIEWDSIHASYVEDRKETDYFKSLKGTIIERAAVVEYISDTYPYEALKAGVKWPSNVDPARREQFLKDDDFSKIFGMTKEEFRALPIHIRKRMKTEKGLF